MRLVSCLVSSLQLLLHPSTKELFAHRRSQDTPPSLSLAHINFYKKLLGIFFTVRTQEPIDNGAAAAHTTGASVSFQLVLHVPAV